MAIGEGVMSVGIGDSVVLHWRPGAGLQSEPPIYKWRGQDLNAGWVTTFNQHAVVSENRCTRILEGTDPDEAALYGCAVTTGFGVIENDAKLKMGESVVVYGAGGVGLNIIQAAGLTSAFPIIAVDIHDNRLQLAKKLGVHYCINARNQNAEGKINEILHSQELDVFIDNTGKPSVIETGYKMTSKGGRVILVGVPKSGENITIFVASAFW